MKMMTDCSLLDSAMSTTTTDTTSQDVKTGEWLSEALKKLLKGIQQRALRVDVKDVQHLNRCFARGNPEPEYEGPVIDSRMYQDLHSFMESLETDPEGRAHVVDHDNTEFTEDSLWLSLPKWQAQLGLDDIQFNVTTIRSIERLAFVKSFEGWKVQHASGPRGTAFVRSEASTKALFSDQPRHVCHGGMQQGSLHPDKLILRVFRCAPRPSLAEGIGSVIQQDCNTNVFDLWIRHHEVPENVSGFGRFQYQVNDAVTLLEMLTAVEMPTPKKNTVCYSPSSAEMPSISGPALSDTKKEDEATIITSSAHEERDSPVSALHTLEHLTKAEVVATPDKEAALEDTQSEDKPEDDSSEDYLSLQEEEDECSMLSAIEEEGSLGVSLQDCDLSPAATPESHAYENQVRSFMSPEDKQDIAHLVEASISSNIMKGTPDVVEEDVSQDPVLRLSKEMQALFGEEAPNEDATAEVAEARTLDASVEEPTKEPDEMAFSGTATLEDESMQEKVVYCSSPKRLQDANASFVTAHSANSIDEYEEEVSEDPLSLLPPETQALFAPESPSEAVRPLTPKEAPTEDDPDSAVNGTPSSLKVHVPTTNRLSEAGHQVNNTRPVLISNLAALFGMPSNVDSDTVLEMEHVDPPAADNTRDLVTEAEENQPPNKLLAGDKLIVRKKDGVAQKKKTARPFSERPLNVPMIRCNDCRTNKAKHDFSKSQLRKPRTRCKDCVTSGQA